MLRSRTSAMLSVKFDVRTIERGIVVVGNENALAAQLIVRSERRAQLRIFDCLREMTERNLLCLFAEGFVAEKTEDAKLLPPENALPESPAGQRYAPKALLPSPRNG